MPKRQAPVPDPKAPQGLLPDVFTIHVIDVDMKKRRRKKRSHDDDSDDDDDETTEPTPAQVKRAILEDYPLLLPIMKRGDAVENLRHAGYRSSGTYFVEAVDAETKTLKIIDRSYEIDEYGSQPLHFTALDDFPPQYFNPDNAQYNDMYHPGNKGSLYWHVDDGWNIISPDLVAKIKRDDDNDDNGTLTYGGQVYRFENISEGMCGSGHLFSSDYDPKKRTFLMGL